MIERISITVLAVAMALFATPLFLDLALCIAGNLLRPRRPGAKQVRAIRLAVVVPAHEEELMIARTVLSLKAAGAEVFVVAHNCTDGTAKAAAAAGAQVLELSDRRRAKSAALRHGFNVALNAGANALMVVDADTVVSANLIAATRAMLEQGAEATQCRYELEGPPAGAWHPLVRLRALAFRGMNVLRARGRAGLGLSTGLFGNGFAITASTLERVPFDVRSIAEDVEYHTRLVAAGVRVFWVDDACVLAHSPASGRAQATQEARWEGGRLHVASRATGRLGRAVLRGRWGAAETLIDVWSLPLSRGILALLLSLFLAVHWLHVFALLCAAVTAVYVVQAATLGPDPLRDLAALGAAPLYIVWKALITPLVLRQSRRRAGWARTKREAHQP